MKKLIALVILCSVAAHAMDHKKVCTKLRAREPSVFSMLDKCYYISDIALNWWDSYKYCRNLRMNLAELSSNISFFYIVIKIKAEKKYERYWLALNDLEKEGRFVYGYSGRRAKFISPIRKFDDTTREQNCVVLDVLRTKVLMKDDSCWMERPFLCEREYCKC